MRAGVALGSNLGGRLENMQKARDQIVGLTNVDHPILASAIYETEPVGCEEGAPQFLNAVIEFDYHRSAQELLRELAAIERSLGRPSSQARNISRPIDLDLLYFGPLHLKTADLQLPHPRMAQREFVLRPLADIRPNLVLPGETDPVSALLQRSVEPGAVVRFATEW